MLLKTLAVVGVVCALAWVISRKFSTRDKPLSEAWQRDLRRR